MAQESTKAQRRRFAEDDRGIFPWRTVFSGRVLDVGCGDNPLPGVKDLTTFDSANADVIGDANHLSQYFDSESFQTINGSHVLEHMTNPRLALRDWLLLLKPGGYVVQTVPDWCAYERMQWPSRHNPDHRSSWSMIYKGSIAPIHIHIPSFLNEFSDVADILLMRYVEENYNWKLPPEIDQTWIEEDGVEIWCEFVIQKHK